MYINLFVRNVTSFIIAASILVRLDKHFFQPNTEKLLGWKSSYFRMHFIQGRVNIQTYGTGTCVPLSVPISKAA